MHWQPEAFRPPVLYFGDTYMKAMSVSGLVFVVALGFAVSTRAQEQTSGAKPAPQAAPAGNADTGKKLWSSYGCWQCHGYEGQGGAAGPRLAGRNLNFGYINGYVRKPTNQMPPYTEKVLPNTDLAHISAVAGKHSALTEIGGPPKLQVPSHRSQVTA
jgi:mono/diheme cytochrome c family protein